MSFLLMNLQVVVGLEDRCKDVKGEGHRKLARSAPVFATHLPFSVLLNGPRFGKEKRIKIDRRRMRASGDTSGYIYN